MGASKGQRLKPTSKGELPVVRAELTRSRYGGIDSAKSLAMGVSHLAPFRYPDHADPSQPLKLA